VVVLYDIMSTKGRKHRTMVKFPEVEVQMGYRENAFAILGRVRKALRRGGASPEQVKEFIAEATSSDYEHLQDTVERWVVTV
jgi:chromosomal replication initiation ATPase DnaA